MKRDKRTMLKRIGAAVLCAVFVLAVSRPAGVSARENTGTALAGIRLSVGDGQQTPVYRAGEKAQLQINVMNSGTVDAQDVRIAPVIENEADWPFEMDQLNYEKGLGTVAAGQQVQALWGTEEEPLTVKSDVTGKAYRLIFKITYDDGATGYETEKYVFVKTVAKDKPSVEKPGGSKPSGPQQGGSQGSSQSGTAGSAKPGQGASGGQSAGAADVDLVPGGVYNSDPVGSGGGSGSDASGSSVPRVIVTGFDTNPGEVKAGSNFKLIIHLKNTSARTAVSNLLFDIQAPAAGTDAAAEAPAFLPSSGSSSIYLDKIPAGGTRDISIDLNARADLVQKPYSVTMNVKYEDSGSAQYEAQSSLAIPIAQKVRFEFSKIQISPEQVAVGEEANISCSLYNLGRVKMYNVKVRFEGKMIESQEIFIGNLDAGATGTIDGIVTAVKETAGEEECKLILSYEDDAGKVTTAEEKFAMSVLAETMPASVDPFVEEMPEEGGVPVGLIIAVIVILAGGAAAAVILIKRRKKMLQEAEEEELFDEVERFTEDER